MTTDKVDGQQQTERDHLEGLRPEDRARCDWCDGTGDDPEMDMPCRFCDGTGRDR